MQSTGQTSTQAVSLVPTHGSQMIYATTISRINPLQPKSIARWLVTAAAAAACLGATVPAAAQRAAQPGTTEPPGTASPAHVALFAPTAHAAAYRAYVSPLTPEALLSTLADDPAAVRTPGAWTVRRDAPLDAFGRSGPYNRSRLARLYGSRAVSVARGARAAGGRVTESWTLLSPYPDPSLERLESGTLVLILTVP